MTYLVNAIAASALKLYDYLFNVHWNGQGLVGPDSGLMFNLRFFRFVKSYIPTLRHSEKVLFLQAQGYWIKSCWSLYKSLNDPQYKIVALACSDNVVKQQRANGSWQYPLKEWQNFVSTVEGTWAALGLLESYDHTKNSIYLDAALKWYAFLVSETKFMAHEDSIVINYFAFSDRGVKVPNNNTLVLYFFARLFEVTGDQKFLLHEDKMIRFLELTQKSNGELMYEINKDHYLCYHYNAFEFLDLFYYYQIVKNSRIRTILQKLADYLAGGVTEKGSVKYNCGQTFPEMPMFACVTGAALKCATSIGLGNYEKFTERIYNYVVSVQKPNGSFSYSSHDFMYVKTPFKYGFLSDDNSYPGPLSFMLDHLLLGSST